MKPALRKRNERRRRRAWAAPFVLTFALSPAACKKSSSETQEPPTRNPPDPSMFIDAATADKAPEPDPKPPPVRQQFASVYKLDNGDCMWAEPDNCAPGDKCNPPPPVKVECPRFLPDKGARGVRKDDGTCEVWVEPDCPKSPDGTIAPCNPPPPEPIPCPE